MTELKILSLSFEWASKVASQSESCLNLIPPPQAASWMSLSSLHGFRCLHACMDFISHTFYQITKLHIAQADFNSHHSCKTSPCVQFPHRARVLVGSPGCHGSTVPRHSSNFPPPKYTLNCRTFFKALLFGSGGASQSPGCYLLLNNCWALQNCNLLKEKKIKNPQTMTFE